MRIARTALLAALALAPSLAAAAPGYRIGQLVEVGARSLVVGTGQTKATVSGGTLLLVPRPADGVAPACPAAYQPVFLLSAEWAHDLGAPDAPGAPPRDWWLCWTQTRIRPLSIEPTVNPVSVHNIPLQSNDEPTPLGTVFPLGAWFVELAPDDRRMTTGFVRVVGINGHGIVSIDAHGTPACAAGAAVTAYGGAVPLNTVRLPGVGRRFKYVYQLCWRSTPR